MRWLRSWPAVIPTNRAYVVDNMERLVLHDYDYSPLGDIDEDVCLLEWDMAISREDREYFEFAVWSSARVLVAPYRLYTVAPHPVWAHRLVTADGLERWVDKGEPNPDYFGFGLIYLPRDLVRAFLAAPAPERGTPPYIPAGRYTDTRFHDQTFSVWHRWHSGAPAAMILWDVRPVHLHY